MASTPTYLLTAASGKIGKRLIPTLLSLPSKPHVVLPTSNAAKLENSLSDELDKTRLHIIEGDIKDPNFVESTLRKHHVTGVSLTLTGEDELFTATKFLDAIQRSGTVKHVVYISACEDYSIDAIKNGSLLGQSAALILVKYIIEAKIRHGTPPRAAPGGFSWTILGPSLFFDNDELTKQQIVEQSVFGVPMGDKGVSRVDTADIGLAVTNALDDDGQRWGGKKVYVGELKTYTAHETAQLWSEALGREIKPALSGRAGLDKLEHSFGQVAGPAWGRDLRLMYETFAERGFKMTQAQYEEQVLLLGRQPNSYRSFVLSAAAQWNLE